MLVLMTPDILSCDLYYWQAGRLALERGWAINLGGGFHHCSSDSGGGFCMYADITLCIRFLFKYSKKVKKALIVDLDAHQVLIFIWLYNLNIKII